MGAKLTIDGGLLKVTDAENVTPYFREAVLVQQAEIVVWLRVIESIRPRLNSRGPAGGSCNTRESPSQSRAGQGAIAPVNAPEIGPSAFDFGETK